MSYILDALKKSEKERQRGSVPDVLTLQDSIAQEPKKRLLWPYLLIVALLLHAGLIVWLLGIWQPKTNKISSPASEQIGSRTLKSMRADTGVPLPVGTASYSQVKTTGSEGKAYVNDSREKSVPPVEKHTKIKVKSAPQDVAVQTQSDVKRRVESKPLQTIDTGTLYEVMPFEPKNVRVTPSGSQNTTDVEIAAGKKVFNLKELPLSIQQKLPAFSISVSLYSDDPSSRMARINGQVIREGQYLTAGLKLEEITPDGVIFIYQNYHFRVGLK
ncbi:MAG: general secretion pathway protein GspB [Nitrospirota bacterium]|nr:general secretion pathway protein GspB [Nitrospirota bacterium]